jgi:hypothetical protein
MKFLKLTTIIALSLALQACLSSGGGSDPAPQFGISAPIDTLPPTNPVPTATLTGLFNKTLTSAYGTILYTGSKVQDTYCGFNYPITSSSEVNGKVVIVTRLEQNSQGYTVTPSDYSAPAHNDCLITMQTIDWYYQYIGSTTKLYFDASHLVIAYEITYTIELVNSTYVVKRDLKTRNYLRSNTVSTNFVTESRTMSDQNYTE